MKSLRQQLVDLNILRETYKREIERNREELSRMVMMLRIRHDQVIQASKALDLKILEFMKISKQWADIKKCLHK